MKRDIPQTWEEYREVFFELRDGSADRSVALVVAACVEEVLRQVLESRLVSLPKEEERKLFDEPGGPFHNFYSKILTGFALGLYGPITKGDLDIIRTIRNSFAHSMKALRFDSPEIEKQCNDLRFLKWISEIPKPGIELQKAQESLPPTPKGRFLTTAGLLAWKLHNTFLPSDPGGTENAAGAVRPATISFNLP
ncbi:MAG: hypothetical protein JJ714_10925 [Acidithiobacillus sp.]|nr:hypothetical protein [Acidithiobacillus sp.]